MRKLGWHTPCIKAEETSIMFAGALLRVSGMELSVVLVEMWVSEGRQGRALEGR